MKRILAALLCAVLLYAGCFPAARAEQETRWICPACGVEASGNFCANCGAKKPSDSAWTCPVCGAEASGNFCANCGAGRETTDAGRQTAGAADGKTRLDLAVAFDKNAYFSTYDVRLLIDDEWIATLRHGVDYACSVLVSPGRHLVTFRKDQGGYAVEASTVIDVAGPSLFSCAIHTRQTSIAISREIFEAIPEDRPLPDSGSVLELSGSCRLRIYIEFRKNAFLSRYDVEVYMDDVLIATLPHGKDYDGTLMVSAGTHTLTFRKAGSRSVSGFCSIRVEGDSLFSCKIEARQDEVAVTNRNLTR